MSRSVIAIGTLSATRPGQKVSKTERIETAVLNSLLPISKKELSRLLPDVSVTTIEMVLGRLVGEEKIKKNWERSLNAISKEIGFEGGGYSPSNPR